MTQGRSFRLDDLVRQFGGTFSGDGKHEVTGFATLENADANQLSFLTNPRYKSQLLNCQAAAILIAPKDAAQFDDKVAARLWVVKNPYVLFARIAQYFLSANQPSRQQGVHASAVVDPSARIDLSAWVGPKAVIGSGTVIAGQVEIGAGCVIGNDAEVGEGSKLYPNVTVYDDCVIGKRAIFHSGAVIGADGFGFAKDNQSWVKIPQTGRVIIGDDVEIGANTTIDRGALEDTVIGNDVKLDNQIQIAHNVRIGDHTAIAGCVAVAGSVVIGQRCTIAGGVRIVGHISLVDDVHVTATTLVTHSLHQPGVYSGAFPVDTHDNWQKNAAALKTLNKLRERIRALEQQLKDSK